MLIIPTMSLVKYSLFKWDLFAIVIYIYRQHFCSVMDLLFLGVSFSLFKQNIFLPFIVNWAILVAGTQTQTPYLVGNTDSDHFADIVCMIFMQICSVTKNAKALW